MSEHLLAKNEGDILLYQTEDGQTRIEVQLVNETVWLSQRQMAELFQKDVRTINEHIGNIFEEGELAPDSTIRNFRIVQIEGTRKVSRDVAHYNLDVIISVGYRVKSHRGTQFRIWATQRLRDYLVMGFLLDDERFKQGKGGHYFDALLARIRDIRASEKEFWRKVLDIYATTCKIKCTGQRTATPPPRSSTPAPMQPGPTWGSPPSQKDSLPRARPM